MRDRDNIKWLYKITRKYIPKIIVLSFSNAILAIIGVLVALLSKKIVDIAVEIAKVPKETTSYTMLLVFGIAMLFTITLRLVIRVFTQSLSVRVQADMEMGMREKLFNSILIKEYDKIGVYHSGEIMNRITSDINIVSSGMVSLLPDTTYMLVQLIGAMAVLMLFDWKFALIFIVGGVFVFIIVSLFRKKLKYLHKKVQETDGLVRSFFQESVESLLVIKTFDVAPSLEEKGHNLQQNNFDAKMKRRKVSIYANAGFGFIFNLGYLYALLWCSFKLCTGAMTYGTLTAVLQLIGQVQSPFANFTKVIPQFFGILASAERIMEMEDIPAENKDYNIIEEIKNEKENFKSIEFKELEFSYGREDVLKGGTVKINKGDFVAIRGISGIGKSTLMKMLLGVFSPKSGRIIIDFENKHSFEASVNTRMLFSYVPQGNYLLSGTLRENLRLVRADATDEEINRALKISDCDEFINKLPQGLDTVIGEKGMGLSEGQVQRMAIARAVLSKAPVILLDEATSALDAKAEKTVLENIKSLKNKTCIIITHKTAALKVCNREIVIDNKLLMEKL